MKKRAQVTIFIILAILIVGAVVGMFIFRDRIFSDSTATPTQLEPITRLVEDCVEATLRDGTNLVGLQGGYSIPPENSLETNFSYIAYGYFLGNDILASKATIEREISTYIELTLPFCFDSSLFPTYNIDVGEVKAETKIEVNFVKTSVNFPLIVSREENSWSFNKKYNSNYNVRLGDMYSVAQKIISKKMQNPNNIDFSFLKGFDYDISILNEGNNLVVYSIQDYNLEGGQSYTFRFANRIR